MKFKDIIRTFGAIVGSLIVTFALLVAVEGFSAIVHPFPAGFDGSTQQMCNHVANYPQWVLIAVVPMWGFIAFLGTWVAAYFGNRGSAIFIGVLLIVAVLFNIAMLPYPIWFKIVQPIVVGLAVVCAILANKKPAPSFDDIAENSQPV